MLHNSDQMNEYMSEYSGMHVRGAYKYHFCDIYQWSKACIWSVYDDELARGTPVLGREGDGHAYLRSSIHS